MAKPYVVHSLSACAGCGCSGDDFGSVNVEAFEVTGELYCDDCAEEALAAHDEDEPSPVSTQATTCIETIGGDPETALRLSFQIKVF